MDPPKSKRRSSARLSSANPRNSNSDGLRKAALSRSSMTPQTGSSAQATPNGTSLHIGSGFSSANNTDSGIANARAQFIREHQETPRTAMLELRKMDSIDRVDNPLDQINAVNADDHFKRNVSAKITGQKKIKDSSMALISNIGSSNFPNSSADLDETLKIQFNS